MECSSSSTYSQKMLHSIYYSSIPPLPIPKNYQRNAVLVTNRKALILHEQNIDHGKIFEWWSRGSHCAHWVWWSETPSVVVWLRLTARIHIFLKHFYFFKSIIKVSQKLLSPHGRRGKFENAGLTEKWGAWRHRIAKIWGEKRRLENFPLWSCF